MKVPDGIHFVGLEKGLSAVERLKRTKFTGQSNASARLCWASALLSV